MKTFSVTKSSVVFAMALGMATTAFAQDFCSNSSHSGQSVKISSNQVGKIGDIGYELWDENGHGGSATFYSDGSMDCSITGAKDYLCRAGLSLGSNKTYKELGGDMIAEFKLVKSPAQNVGYSYIGVYGWMEGVSGTPSQLVEYYVIDNTLANDMPGSWIGNERKGTITVDGGTYTVYRNTRTGPAIKSSGNVTFYQYFSVRTSPRDCGTINISEHMRQWEKMGMTMGKLYEAKVLGEAGNVNGEVRNGRMDFPHAKVYVKNGSDPASSSSVKSSSSTVTPKSSSSKGSGVGPVVSTEFCKDAQHTGDKKTENGNKVGSINGIGYELWYDRATSGSATFYSDGSMSCSFQNAGDYLCRSGLSFNSDKTYKELDGDMLAEYKLVKQNVNGADYSYVGVYGWMEGVPGTQSQLVEYYVVDNWLSQYRPGDWVGNKKYGTFTIDGAEYDVYRNTRTGPAIKSSGNVEFYQYFSVRKQARDCGVINISAHMKKWEELGMTMGKLYEAKVLGEAGSNGGGVSGTADFPHAKVYVAKDEPVSSSSEAKVESSSSQTIGLIAAPKMELKSGNFQVFDMQGRFLGTVKLDAGASVAQVLKANFKNAGIYMVKQGNFMQRVAVK